MIRSVDRVKQRVARGEQVGARLAVEAGQLLIERHPLVAVSTGRAGADLAVPVADVGGDVADLVAAATRARRSCRRAAVNAAVKNALM